MQTQLLTCAYVVLNSPPANSSSEPSFGVDLFDSPNQTQLVHSPLGLEIATRGKFGLRRLLFNRHRIELMHDTPELLASSFDKIAAECQRVGLPLVPRAHGMNVEFEFQLPSVNAATWIADRALSLEFRNRAGSVEVRSLHLRLKGRAVTEFKIEPRLNSIDRVFVYANIHKESSQLLTGESLASAAHHAFQVAQSEFEKLVEG